MKSTTSHISHKNMPTTETKNANEIYKLEKKRQNKAHNNNKIFV